MKGALDEKMQPDLSPANLRRSVIDCTDALGTYIDMFEPSRLNGVTPVEDVMATLKQLLAEGLIKYIGLSEVNGDTLRKAEKVDHPLLMTPRTFVTYLRLFQVAHVTAVEVEVSPWSYSEATQKGGIVPY